MSGTSFPPINTSETPAMVQTTANAMAEKPAARGTEFQRGEPTIVQSTSELLELSTGPNAQIIHHADAAHTRVPLDTDDDEMIQKLPRRKRTGNSWTNNKKGPKTTATERSTIPAAAAAHAEADPSREEWAANLRRVVFQPSDITTKSSTSPQKPPGGPLTQSPTHVIYFPRPALVDNGKDFDIRGNNRGHTAAVTGPLHEGTSFGGYVSSNGA